MTEKAEQSLDPLAIGREVDGAPEVVEQPPSRLRRLLGQRELGIISAAIFLFIILSLINQEAGVNKFTQTENLLTIARQISLVTIMAVGMTYVIISGEIDLAIGSTFGVSGIALGLLIKDGHDPWFALLAALALGTSIGLFNGAVSTKFGVPSFVVTLGMLSALRGVALALAGGWPVAGLPSDRFFAITGGFLVIATDTYTSIPMQVIWMIVVLLIGWFVLSKTRYGYHLYATGSNKQAAILNGIPTDRVKILAFMFTGFLAALAASLQLGFFKSFQPTNGQGLELEVIAAVIIGGTNLFGGSGNILGTLVGAAIIGMITNGLILAGVPTYWQFVAIGLIIIFAVVLDVQIRKRQR
ncbi:MAG: ABC transporter permease [Chloroflexota bacterium]|nr:ABC transporter permease [Chloroflexota bacterium]